jgi:hypothetical protein
MLFKNSKLNNKIKEKFYTTGATGRYGSPITFSIYKNPTLDEIKKYIPHYARGWIINNGDLYLEGIEPEYELNYNSKYSGPLHIDILHTLKKENNKFKNLEYISDIGIPVQRIGGSRKIALAEGIHKDEIKYDKDLSDEEVEEYLNDILFEAQSVNPYWEFINDNINELNEGLKESYFASGFESCYHYDPDYYPDGMNNVDVYINPSHDEFNKYIPKEARAFIDTKGNFYVEGYKDPNQASQNYKDPHNIYSNTLHSSILNILKSVDPKLIKNSIKDCFDNINFGVPLQRYKGTNTFYIGESLLPQLYLKEPGKARIIKYLTKAKEKNPSIKFIIKSILKAKEPIVKKGIKEDALTDPTMFNNPVSGRPSTTSPLSSDQGKNRELDFKSNMSKHGNSDIKLNTQAWDLAKDRAKTSLQHGEQDPNYWDYVYDSAMTNMGIQNTGNQPTFESIYKSVKEDFELLETSNINKYDDNGLDPQSRLQAAKSLAKQLKSRGLSDNEIIYSIVNRLRLTTKEVLEALKDAPDTILDSNTENKDPIALNDYHDINQILNTETINDVIKDENSKFNDKSKEQLEEDNYYNHVKVSKMSNPNPQYDYDFNTNRDNFEWEMNSTNVRSRALIVENKYTFEVIFKVMNSTMVRWPKLWDFLTKQHNINTVLQISVNQLNANTNYLKVTPDSTPINSGSVANVLNTMIKVMTSYSKIWGSNHYQIIVLQTDNPNKVDFLFRLAQSLHKSSSSLNIDTKLSAEMCDIPMHLATKHTLYLVLKNTKGKKYSESDENMNGQTDDIEPTPDNPENTESNISESKIDEDEGVVMSSDFINQCPSGKGSTGLTGDQINKQARKHLDQYAANGFESKLESQIKVLQKKANGFDIIDVIDRDTKNTFNSKIRYKGNEYQVKSSLKYNKCIIIG